MTRFMVTALSSALELGIGTADDVLAHVTPDVLAQHLPRPLWARLITACLGAPKVNAQLVVDTIGMSNLCEHMPGNVMWAVLSDIGQRALGREKDRGAVVATPSVAASPPAADQTAPTATPTASRSRSPSRQPPFGRSVPAPSSNAGAASRAGGSLSGNSRRPQAAATTPPAATPQPASALVGSRVTPPSARRGATSSDFDIDTDVRADWKGKEVEVEDEQLVDWSSAEETVTSGDYSERKR